MKQDNKKLREGKWWVGNGTNIPLDHLAWFQTSNLHNPNLTTGTVVDLICNLVWKVIHDSLPTFQTLKGRGIPIATLCPFCECGCFVTSNNNKKN